MLMAAIDELEHKVRDLYEAQDPKRDSWADWLYANHVFVVQSQARELAQNLGANEDLCRAAAVLHDVADVQMKRMDAGHEQASLRLARKLLREFGYNANDIKIVVDDALKLHSCRDGVSPKTLEGQILSTADALAHLTTDFYVYATWAKGREMPLKALKEWTVKKATRDFEDKIRFDDVRERVRGDYERITTLFAR
jgi:putative nucleotidyltransferase with HDIG domain